MLEGVDKDIKQVIKTSVLASELEELKKMLEKIKEDFKKMNTK